MRLCYTGYSRGLGRGFFLAHEEFDMRSMVKGFTKAWPSDVDNAEKKRGRGGSCWE